MHSDVNIVNGYQMLHWTLGDVYYITDKKIVACGFVRIRIKLLLKNMQKHWRRNDGYNK